jgi:hypothetical protein
VNPAGDLNTDVKLYPTACSGGTLSAMRVLSPNLPLG